MSNSGSAFMLVPWANEAQSPADAPCFLEEFDLTGVADKVTGGDRTSDESERPSNTYLRYRIDEDGELPSACSAEFEARFGFEGQVYFVTGTLARAVRCSTGPRHRAAQALNATSERSPGAGNETPRRISPGRP